MAEDHPHDDEHQHGHDHAHGGDGHGHGHGGVTVRGPVEGSFVPRPAAGLHAIGVDQEVLLLDPRTDRLHLLDAVASVIWSVLDGEVTVDELAGDLADAFEVPVPRVRSDLDGLVRALDAAALLDGIEPQAHQLVGAPPGPGERTAGSDEAEGLWRPDYLENPPAP